MSLILRWLVTAASVGVALWLVPGIEVTYGSQTWLAIFVFALVFSLVNMLIKPILQVLSLPITVLTLGIFYLIVNTFLLYLASWISEGIFRTGITIDSFGSAFVAALVISIVSSLMNSVIKK